MSPVNVLYIHHGGGRAGVQNNLARFWSAMDRASFAPHLACQHDGLLTERAAELGLPVLKLKLPAWRKLWQRLGMRGCVRRLADYCRAEHIRLVVANDFWFAPHAILAAGQAGVPSLVYVRLSD